MNNLKKYMVINGLLYDKGLDEISNVIGESVETIADEVFGISANDLIGLFDRMSTLKKDIDEPELVRVFVNFLRMSENAFSTNDVNNTVITPSIVRDMVLAGEWKDPNIIRNILVSMFTCFVESNTTYISDGVIYSKAEDSNNLEAYLMKAFAYYAQTSLISKQQLMMMADMCGITGSVKSYDKKKLGNVIMRFVNKGYHPCVLAKTCLDVPYMWDVYQMFGTVVQRTPNDPSNVYFVSQNPDNGDLMLSMCNQGAFTDLIRESHK